MAFRKRNIAVGTGPLGDKAAAPTAADVVLPPSIRPSPLTSHPVTSTGCASLDSILGGHSGLALGSSLLIGEHGTTDFAGALLRYYAAEGIVQGHVLHVVGVGEGWVRELPGLAEGGLETGEKPKASDGKAAEERMKIAWRYEKLGQAGERVLPDRSVSHPVKDGPPQETSFCHTFDLTKRLAIPPEARVNYNPLPPTPNPFQQILDALLQSLHNSQPASIHRLIIPNLLSPALYPQLACEPQNLLTFLHALRALLRRHSTTLTAMITLPLALYPRSTALVRWAETLLDGVLELTPFPHLMDASTSNAEGKGGEEQPQGMLHVHKLPIVTRRGEGGAGGGNSIGEDLAFTVSRRKFVIRPYSLPPVGGDEEAQKEAGKVTAKDVEF